LVEVGIDVLGSAVTAAGAEWQRAVQRDATTANRSSSSIVTRANLSGKVRPGVGSIRAVRGELPSRLAVALLAPMLLLTLARCDRDFTYGEFDDPKHCHTALAQVATCRGEDTSFQECHFRYRADGTPNAQVCAAFLGAADAGPAEIESATKEHCPERSPIGWEKVPCARFHVDPSWTCFTCAEHELEVGRTLVQAFDPSCGRGVVLKACNEPLP
jgi:hypothetical protein